MKTVALLLAVVATASADVFTMPTKLSPSMIERQIRYITFLILLYINIILVKEPVNCSWRSRPSPEPRSWLMEANPSSTILMTSTLE